MDYEAEYNRLLQHITAMQREIADVLHFVEYAEGGHVEGVSGDAAKLWAATQFTRIARQLLEL